MRSKMIESNNKSLDEVTSEKYTSVPRNSDCACSVFPFDCCGHFVAIGDFIRAASPLHHKDQRRRKATTMWRRNNSCLNALCDYYAGGTGSLSCPVPTHWTSTSLGKNKDLPSGQWCVYAPWNFWLAQQNSYGLEKNYETVRSKFQSQRPSWQRTRFLKIVYH